MNEPECTAFRRALSSALAPGVETERPERETRADVESGWHEHLLACPACRAFLDAEAALDGLLATLPRARLPGDLARRVLARLEGARAEERLDDLLDLLPRPAQPADLAARTLRRLAAERRGWRRLVGGGRRIAAALLIAAGATWLVLAGRDGAPEEPPPATGAVGQVEDELLESLDVLENWELLMSDDVDVALAELDTVDWTLLEYGSEDAEPENGAEPQKGG